MLFVIEPTICYVDAQGKVFAVIIDRLHKKAAGCVYDKNCEGVTFANKIIMNLKVVAEKVIEEGDSDFDIAEALYSSVKKP